MRKQPYLVLALLLGLAALSAWLLQVEERPGPAARPAPPAPDYFLEGFVSTVMNLEGLPQYRLQASRLLHYDDDGRAELIRPTLTYFRPQLPAWQAEAEQGLVLHDGEVIHLGGEVRLWRDSGPGRRAITLLTRDLLVRPEQDYAHTEAPVTVLSDGNRVDSVGMRLYLAEGRLELLSDVRGRYERP